MKKLYLFASLSIATLTSNLLAAELQPATFENLPLPTESYWIGDTENPDYTTGEYRSGSFVFKNMYTAAWGSWAFFGYANLTGNVYTTYTNMDEQMMNIVGGGHDSATYTIVYCDAYNGPCTATIPDFAETGVEVPGMWYTNSAWVVSSILNGDGFSGAFETGDSLHMTVTGTHPDSTESSVTTILADYTSENADEHYYVSDWRWLDLSSLGEVTQLTFSMETTKMSQWGPITPSYFAIDDLGVQESHSGITHASNDNRYHIAISGNDVTVNGTSETFPIEIYSLDGTHYATSIAKSAKATLSLPSGLYILTTPTDTHKILIP